MKASWNSRFPNAINLGKEGEKEWRYLKLTAKRLPNEKYLTGLCFSVDGKTLYASGCWSNILRWDAATGKELPPLGKHEGNLRVIALSADGRCLATATAGGSLYFWETATGQLRQVIRDAGKANTMAFAPDGRLLALVDQGQIQFLRLADGKRIRRYSGHLGDIACLSFSPDGRRLASGGHDTTVLVWGVPDLREKNPPVLESAKLEKLWTALSESAEAAHRSMATLTASPAQSVPFLRAKLKPPPLDAPRVARLLKQLDSATFREREEAGRELKSIGEAVEPALYKAMKEKPSLEMRRRLQRLLDELRNKGNVTGERLRSLRALEVLERIGDKQAREVLRSLLEGEMGTRLMEEAKTALRRLQHRSP